MPRTDTNHVRTAPFIVGPWRHTTREKKTKKRKSEGDEVDGEIALAGYRAASTLTTSTAVPAPPPPPPPHPLDHTALEKEPEMDYDSAWDEESHGEAEENERDTKTFSGRGYLSFYPTASSPLLSAPSRVTSSMPPPCPRSASQGSRSTLRPQKTSAQACLRQTRAHSRQGTG